MDSNSIKQVALFSIHPQYANALMDGTKKVEFRKRRPASDVTEIVVYSTSPVQKIVCVLQLSEVVEASPAELWEQFSEVGGIARTDFDRYFLNCSIGFAFVVEICKLLAPPIHLEEIGTKTPPQSFQYLSSNWLDQVSDRSVSAI